MEKKIVLFRSFGSDVEANIIKGVLETNGIQCFLSNEIFSSVLPLTYVSTGAIRLSLFEEDVPEAERILNTTPVSDRIF